MKRNHTHGARLILQRRNTADYAPSAPDPLVLRTDSKTPHIRVLIPWQKSVVLKAWDWWSLHILMSASGAGGEAFTKQSTPLSDFFCISNVLFFQKSKFYLPLFLWRCSQFTPSSHTSGLEIEIFSTVAPVVGM